MVGKNYLQDLENNGFTYFTIKVEKHCIEKIDKLSAELGLSKSQVVENAINYYCTALLKPTYTFKVLTYIKLQKIKDVVANIWKANNKRKNDKQSGFSLPMTCYDNFLTVCKQEEESAPNVLTKCICFYWFSRKDVEELNGATEIVNAVLKLLGITDNEH